jgi:hypothetical protein
MGDTKAVALGDDVHDVVVVDDLAPVSVETKLEYFEQILKQHTEALDNLFSVIKDIKRSNAPQPTVEKLDEELEKVKSSSKIPVGTTLVGITKGTPFWLAVKEDGFYVGIHKFNSLSAAAEKVSGVRRSGHAFWKFYEGKYTGKSVKEVYCTADKA